MLFVGLAIRDTRRLHEEESVHHPGQALDDRGNPIDKPLHLADVSLDRRNVPDDVPLDGGPPSR